MKGNDDSLDPAVVDIVSKVCDADMGTCTVTAVVTVLRTPNEEVQSEPDVMVGTVTADVVERESSPELQGNGNWLHTYDATAVVDCDATHEITAEASILKAVSATPDSVDCGSC